MNKYDLNHRVAHHSEDVGCRMGGGLPRGLGDLLHARAHPHDPAPRRRQSARPAEDDIDHDPVVLARLIEYEGVHPLEGGVFRLKFRRDRRAGLPRESPLVFYPRYWRRDAGQGLAVLVDLPAARKAMLNEIAGRARPLDLHRPRDRAAEGATSSRRSISITRPPAARRRSPAKRSATTSASPFRRRRRSNSVAALASPSKDGRPSGRPMERG